MTASMQPHDVVALEKHRNTMLSTIYKVTAHFSLSGHRLMGSLLELFWRDKAHSSSRNQSNKNKK
jgi:hypothetical protein